MRYISYASQHTQRIEIECVDEINRRVKYKFLALRG